MANKSGQRQSRSAEGENAQQSMTTTTEKAKIASYMAATASAMARTSDSKGNVYRDQVTRQDPL